MNSNARSSCYMRIRYLLQQYLLLMRLDKPIGIFLLLAPIAWAFCVMFFPSVEHCSLKRLFFISGVFVIGVIITRSAGCVINDICDRNFDKYVKRTAARPLASEAISVKGAWRLFIVLVAMGAMLAFFTLRLSTLFIAIIALFILMTYPLCKRYFALPQAYLALAFSIGILMFLNELKGYIPLVGWLLFVINFFWVLGFDTVYALNDVIDDKRLGLKSSTILFGARVNNFIASFYVLMLLGLLALGIYLHANWFFYCGLPIAMLLLIYQCLQIAKQNITLRLFTLNAWVGLNIAIMLFIGSYHGQKIHF